MAKCKHKKLILASGHDLEFSPDQEPFESGTIECADVSTIRIVYGVTIHYCPKCNTVVDISLEPDSHIETDECTSGNRCNGH